jgi:CDP-6-deoxy-D-xylo-4-hexulose-3-dehydrase
LNQNVHKRRENYQKFLEILDPEKFQVDFRTEGNSNYAFTLILNEPDFLVRDKVEGGLRSQGIEFRRGLSGGGNQLRQPYLRRLLNMPDPKTLPNVDHVHHFGWYIGNYPELNDGIYSAIMLALRDI